MLQEGEMTGYLKAVYLIQDLQTLDGTVLHESLVRKITEQFKCEQFFYRTQQASVRVVKKSP